jgi:hypothetical protein
MRPTGFDQVEINAKYYTLTDHCKICQGFYDQLRKAYWHWTDQITDK